MLTNDDDDDDDDDEVGRKVVDVVFTGNGKEILPIRRNISVSSDAIKC